MNSCSCGDGIVMSLRSRSTSQEMDNDGLLCDDFVVYFKHGNMIYLIGAHGFKWSRRTSKHKVIVSSNLPNPNLHLLHHHVMLSCCRSTLEKCKSRPGDETADWKHQNKFRRNFGKPSYVGINGWFPQFRRFLFLCFQSAVSSPGLEMQ